MINKCNAPETLESQRQTFVASLGHDLKNPTIAQMRAMELLLQGFFGDISSNQREILEMVLDSCKYMNAMLCSLLATYRIEKGTVTLNCDDVPLNEIVEECVNEMIYLAKEKEIQVNISKSYSNPTVFVDRVQLQRVILNFLSNGIKYAYRESKLNISTFEEQGFIGFKFQNSSPYIPPKKRKTIFAKYVTFAEAHKEFGIGLGLYASKKIIDAHDGKIFVKSFKNNINTFGFKLPKRINNRNKLRRIIWS